MIRASQDQRDSLLEYLAPYAVDCLYLYLDVYHYGLASKEVAVWYEKRGDTYALIAMRYLDSLHVYSRDDVFDVCALCDLVRELGVVRIHARKSTAGIIASELSADFEVEYGKVIEKTSSRNLQTQHGLVELATLEDLEEVSSVVLMGEEFAQSYTYEDMLNTLTDLVESGMGRCYVIRENGVIVATETITAESDLFMIGSYLVVHPDYRHTLYGAVIESYLCHVAKGDKRLFAMVTNQRRAKMLEMLGNPVVAEYGKLVQLRK